MAGIGPATDHPPTSAQVVSASQRRRGKSALFLVACGVAGLGPHWLEPGLRLMPASALALLLGGYSIRTVLVPALSRTRGAGGGESVPFAAGQAGQHDSAPPAPAVDVVVAARDEQAVIGRLVEGIARLRYPSDALRLWVIDDGSSDRTPQVLAELQADHPFLRVLRREPDAGGGKSGALNLALQHVEAPWMLVLDADADLQPDTLERLMPLAEGGGWAAVQLRKAVANPDANWLTRAQAMEMALDTVVQEGRLSVGGVVELRGNGQLLRRCALEQVENSTPLQQFQPQKGSKYALIFGNEVFGVEEEVLKACDEVLEIPQLGTKHSLNISVTLGIAVWDMMVKLGEIC